MWLETIGLNKNDYYIYLLSIKYGLNMDMMGSKLIQIDKVDENGVKTLNMGKC